MLGGGGACRTQRGGRRPCAASLRLPAHPGTLLLLAHCCTRRTGDQEPWSTSGKVGARLRCGCGPAELPNTLEEHSRTPIAGLFDWSMQHREEGDGPPRPMSEGDRHFLEDALKSAMIDLSQRMADIKDSLDAGGAGAAAGDGGGPAAGDGSGPASLEAKERLLDELLDIVEQIDLAKGGWRVRGRVWPAWWGASQSCCCVGRRAAVVHSMCRCRHVCVLSLALSSACRLL